MQFEDQLNIFYDEFAHSYQYLKKIVTLADINPMSQLNNLVEDHFRELNKLAIFECRNTIDKVIQTCIKGIKNIEKNQVQPATKGDKQTILDLLENLADAPGDLSGYSRHEQNLDMTYSRDPKRGSFSNN